MWQLIEGDVLERLAELEPESVQTCVTSPPYFQLRDYDHEGQIGLEPTLEEYVAKIVEVAGGIRRVLRRDGIFWLNIGDSYASKPRGTDDYSSCRLTNPGTQQKAQRAALRPTDGRHRGHSSGIKHKDLLLIPSRVALALQQDGWWVRMDVIWHKPNPTPESMTDRPTRAHEFIFMLTKAERYYFDAAAIREEGTGRDPGNLNHKYADAYEAGDEHLRTKAGLSEMGASESHNKPSVWTVAKVPFSGRTDRRVRVEPGDADGDTERITSPDCPLHGDHSGPVSTALRGEREALDRSRSLGSGDHPAQGLLADSASTDQRPELRSEVGSSDSPDPSRAHAATPRSTQSRRTDPSPATTTPCTPSGETPSRTADTSAPPESSPPHPDSAGRKIDAAGSDDPPRSGISDRTAHRPSQRASEACTCEHYRLKRIDHFACFPPKLIVPCILAGSRPGDLVLDPFAGSGTTLMVAERLQRDSIGIELNPEYVALARERILGDAPLLNAMQEVEPTAVREPDPALFSTSGPGWPE